MNQFEQNINKIAKSFGLEPPNDNPFDIYLFLKWCHELFNMHECDVLGSDLDGFIKDKMVEHLKGNRLSKHMDPRASVISMITSLDNKGSRLNVSLSFLNNISPAYNAEGIQKMIGVIDGARKHLGKDENDTIPSDYTKFFMMFLNYVRGPDYQAELKKAFPDLYRSTTRRLRAAKPTEEEAIEIAKTCIPDRKTTVALNFKSAGCSRASDDDPIIFVDPHMQGNSDLNNLRLNPHLVEKILDEPLLLFQTYVFPEIVRKADLCDFPGGELLIPFLGKIASTPEEYRKVFLSNSNMLALACSRECTNKAEILHQFIVTLEAQAASLQSSKNAYEVRLGKNTKDLFSSLVNFYIAPRFSGLASTFLEIGKGFAPNIFQRPKFFAWLKNFHKKICGRQGDKTYYLKEGARGQWVRDSSLVSSYEKEKFYNMSVVVLPCISGYIRTFVARNPRTPSETKRYIQTLFHTKSNVIVTLTEDVNNTKTEYTATPNESMFPFGYWKGWENKSYKIEEIEAENFFVSLDLPEYITVRKLKISHRSKDVREVYQVHIRCWVDHGVLPPVILLLALVVTHKLNTGKYLLQGLDIPPAIKEEIDRFLEFSKTTFPPPKDKGSSITVHCEKGIGRAGVFTLVNSLTHTIVASLKKKKSASEIDVNILYSLELYRAQRDAVQTREQLAYIYEFFRYLYDFLENRPFTPVKKDNFPTREDTIAKFATILQNYKIFTPKSIDQYNRNLQTSICLHYKNIMIETFYTEFFDGMSDPEVVDFVNRLPQSNLRVMNFIKVFILHSYSLSKIQDSIDATLSEGLNVVQYIYTGQFQKIMYAIFKYYNDYIFERELLCTLRDTAAPSQRDVDIEIFSKLLEKPQIEASSSNWKT